jgi:hypothetical protein
MACGLGVGQGMGKAIIRRATLIGMTWSWRYEDADGALVDGPTETFSSQADAESWLGQVWKDLSASGVAEVVLLEGERIEYRMSLTAA